MDVLNCTVSRGHLPTFRYAQAPDGLALCLVCWRVIAADQLGARACGGPRKAVA